LYQKRNSSITFQKLLLELRSSLSAKGFEQIPQLTSSRPLDCAETAFSLSNHASSGGGTKRALLVGINYIGQNGQLSGCQNDVYNVKKYIMDIQGYHENNILVLVDDNVHHYPTRSNMIKSLQQLVAQSVSGDSIYFHYSGKHGTHSMRIKINRCSDCRLTLWIRFFTHLLCPRSLMEKRSSLPFIFLSSRNRSRRTVGSDK